MPIQRENAKREDREEWIVEERDQKKKRDQK
jgi:hypothetical protein